MPLSKDEFASFAFLPFHTHHVMTRTTHTRHKCLDPEPPSFQNCEKIYSSVVFGYTSTRWTKPRSQVLMQKLVGKFTRILEIHEAAA
jgi:hypothetical protein